MNRTLRIVAIVVVVLLLLVVIVPFLIPVDKFRPTIEEKASQALGRKVQLGDLSFSLLRGSLSAENLSVGDDPKFSTSPFLTAKSLKVGVEIMPLIFSKTLNVTGITIENPEVNLLRNPAGQWNYSTLGGAAAKSAQKPAASSSTAPADFSVQKFALNDGRITVGSTTSQKRSTYDHVDIVASNFSVTSKFPVTVTADLPSGGKFKLDGTAGPIDQTDASLTPIEAKLEVNSLDLGSTGFRRCEVWSWGHTRSHRESLLAKWRSGDQGQHKNFQSTFHRGWISRRRSSHGRFQYQIRSTEKCRRA